MTLISLPVLNNNPGEYAINILSDFSLFKNHLSQLNHNRTTLLDCNEFYNVHYFLRIMSSDIIISLLIIITV